jgi:hypothetical protein
MATDGMGRWASATDSISWKVLQMIVSASANVGLVVMVLWIMALRDTGLLPRLIHGSLEASMAGILGFSWILSFLFTFPANVELSCPDLIYITT